VIFHTQRRWRLKFRRDPDAGRVLFIGPLVISFDVVRGPPSSMVVCVETGEVKDARGCWNVRCQLGRRCCRIVTTTKEQGS
jgi:hypothetical protein